ncbi:MAG TPA: FAD:protein FMN transferase [Alphaproteobacteria bacterium]|nr:FAD:protein FMN transferase [Alphaproteobacteria bacterium]
MDEGSTSKPPDPPLHHLAFRAMNCDMAVWVMVDGPHEASQHLSAVKDFMQQLEACLSRFHPESELSRLNARAGQVVPVGDWLWEVLNCALDGAGCSGGLFDPTILDALEAVGYDRTFPNIVKTAAPLLPVMAPTHSWRDITLDRESQCVTLPPGLRLDLGGVAKGWAADRASALLAGLGPCLVDAGGDIAVRGSLPGLTGWPIGVADPRCHRKDLALLLVCDRGIATSGVDYRRWQRGGVMQHHLIDPRTRRPALTDLLTVTVVAPTATQADLHASVALLLGARQGWRYLTAQRDAEGLFVCADGTLLETPGLQRYRAPNSGVDDTSLAPEISYAQHG